MTGTNARILCTGRIYCDLVMSGLSAPPAAGQEVYAEALALTAGGGAYITAAYLAALGWDVGLAAVIPSEPFGGAIAAELAAAGLDLGPSTNAPAGLDPQITVAMIMGGDRAFVTRRSGPALPEGLGRLIDAGEYGHLHIGELASLVENPNIAARAKAAGMGVSVDCAWDAEVLARTDLVEILRDVDVFFPNRMEADALSRHAPVAAFARKVVVKDGENGAEMFADGGSITHPAHPVTVVDTVGAGDAYNAGFLDALLRSGTPSDCMEAGAYVASIALGRVGGARGLGRLARHRAAAE